MASPVDQVLEQRRHRIPTKETAGTVLISVLSHVALGLGFVFLPALFAEPPEQLTYVSVLVVPASALGAEEPPPPPAKTPAPPPPEPAPAEAAKEPEPDVPVLKTEDKKPKPAPPPPQRTAPPAPPVAQDVPKRQGSPFGSALGASTSKASLGVEDPNFTYGYYIDRVVTVLSGNWVRPPVGADIQNALFYFRIQSDGRVTELRLVQSSGSSTFDDAARRAIEASSPLPPLPRGYKREFLGINLIVK